MMSLNTFVLCYFNKSFANNCKIQSLHAIFLSIILILVFFICLSNVSYISKAIFHRKWYGFNGRKRNKTTIYYMRNELVSTFTDMTRLVKMVETRKLRNFFKTFF